MTDLKKQARWAVAAVVLASVVAAPLSPTLAQAPGGPPPSGGAPQGGPGSDGKKGGAGPGQGPTAPDSAAGTGPGAPGAPAPGQLTPYSPAGTHLQQTLDVGKAPQEFHIRVSGQTSLLHVGLGDSFSLTEAGINAGKLLLEALEGKALEAPTEGKAVERMPEDVKAAKGNPSEGVGTLTPAIAPGGAKPATPAAPVKKTGIDRGPATLDVAKLKEAKAALEKLIPIENFGGEYTALLWFEDYLLADDAGKQTMLADPFVAQYFEMFAENDWQGLKEFLVRKYHLREIGDEWSKEGFRRKAELAHTLIFNNPNRETWEKTSKLLDLLKIKPGMEVADVGSGAGYYSIKLAEKVGPTGKIYAIEMEEDRINYVNKVAANLGIKNVVSVLNDGQTLALGDRQVDVVLMVSLYHNIYAMTTARERNTLIEDIRKRLKPDGRLVIVDNSVVPPGTVPYHGPYVAKELVVAQLVNFGFKLVDMQQYIPQRYVLVFQLDDAPAPAEALEAAKKAAESPVGFGKPVQMAPLTEVKQ